MEEDNKKFHFIGIGGVGMSAIANVMLDMGYEISGSDISTSEVIQQLQTKGAKIYIGHNKTKIDTKMNIVISSAIKDSNEELLFAKENNLKIYHRSDLLSLLLNDKKGIAVAGAHGKTTTSSMISVVLEYAKKDPTIIIGGFVDYLKGNSKLGKSEFLVAEADESDGTFLKFYPYISVLTNIEDDHMDFYKTTDNILNAFKQYLNNIHKDGGLAVVCVDNEPIRNLIKKVDRKYITYGIDNEADYMAKNIELAGGITYFDVFYKGEKLGNIKLNLPGLHNVLNALATVSVAHFLGVDIKTIAKGLLAFTGTKRRFETKFKNENIWIVDDYAHHPTEIKTSIKSAKQAAQKRLIVAFQPHRYSRTQLLKEEFGKSFFDADVLILTDIYSASEEKIDGIDGKTLVKEVCKNGLEPIYIENKDKIADFLAQFVKPGDLLITMGAGDIYKVGEDLAKKFK